MIEAEKATYAIKRMCELLEVSRSGFYKWRAGRDRGPSPSQRRRAGLDAKVAASHAASDGVYGRDGSWPICVLRARGSPVRRWRRRCAGSGWPGSARGDSRRPPR